MDYSPKIAKAAAKIAKFGREVVYVRKGGAYDPISGNLAADNEETRINGLLTSPKEDAIASGTIQIGDMWLLIAGNALPEMPATGDIVRIGGIDWRVEGVSSVMPDGTPIIYKLQIRRS